MATPPLINVYFFTPPVSNFLTHTVPVVSLAKLFQSHHFNVFVVLTPFQRAHLPTRKCITDAAGVKHKALNFNFRDLDDTKLSELHQDASDDLLHKDRPHFIVADRSLTWMADVATSLGIPYILFNVFPMMSMMATATDDYHYAERTGLGSIHNTFYELEAKFIDQYKKNHYTWCVGPVSLVNYETAAGHGNRPIEEANEMEQQCLQWLETISSPRSVFYLRSTNFFTMDETTAKLMSDGLESSGHHFVWMIESETTVLDGITLVPVSYTFPFEYVVEDHEVKIPANLQDFQTRMKGKGIIIHSTDRPHVEILNHPAIGGFLTHCEWNSTLEAMTVGVPLVTWPLLEDNLLVEKLITGELGIGVSADNGRTLCAAIQAVMGSRGKDMRTLAVEYGKKAKTATETGGSSHEDRNSLMDDLRKYLAGKEKVKSKSRISGRRKRQRTE